MELSPSVKSSSRSRGSMVMGGPPAVTLVLSTGGPCLGSPWQATGTRAAANSAVTIACGAVVRMLAAFEPLVMGARTVCDTERRACYHGRFAMWSQLLECTWH